MAQRFKDKTVVVTGASSGIGEAAARMLAAEGANVVLAGSNITVSAVSPGRVAKERFIAERRGASAK